MVIAIDFDGTCVRHAYPKIGEEIGAVPVLKRLVEEGHKLILYTMRSDIKGISPVTGKEENGGLLDAIEWFERHEIELYAVQQNPSQKNWTSSPKCYAELYIDDAALGCPLITPYGENGKERPFVDWRAIEMILESSGVLKVRTAKKCDIVSQYKSFL